MLGVQSYIPFAVRNGVRVLVSVAREHAGKGLEEILRSFLTLL